MVVSRCRGDGGDRGRNHRGTLLVAERAGSGSRGSRPATEATSANEVQVEVATPKKGGLPKTITSPGSVHALEEADLFAQAYGYLSELNVDIGDLVKKDDVLARISVPELVQEVAAAKAVVEQSDAALIQAKAKVDVAEADEKAAEATVLRQNAALKHDEARMAFQSKVYERVQKLVKQNAIDEQLADEKEDLYLASQSDVEVAKAMVTSAELDVKAAMAVWVRRRPTSAWPKPCSTWPRPTWTRRKSA